MCIVIAVHFSISQQPPKPRITKNSQQLPSPNCVELTEDLEPMEVHVPEDDSTDGTDPKLIAVSM